jgi:predicted Fe-Mo cluster-binding NifX family protein
MKIAAVSNNGKTISAHFGKARYFVVITAEDGKILSRELIDRTETSEELSLPFPAMPGAGRPLKVINLQEPAAEHKHGHAAGALKRHDIEQIKDCDLVLSRGMGGGMLLRLQQANLRTILTDVMDIEEAIGLFFEGKLRNHPELVH